MVKPSAQDAQSAMIRTTLMSKISPLRRLRRDLATLILYSHHLTPYAFTKDLARIFYDTFGVCGGSQHRNGHPSRAKLYFKISNLFKE